MKSPKTKLEPPPTARGQRRILLIERDERVRRRQRRQLVRAGYAVHATASVVAGWNALKSGQYDLLIIDRMAKEVSDVMLAWRLDSTGLELPMIFTQGGESVEVVNPAPTPAPWFDGLRRNRIRLSKLTEIAAVILRYVRRKSAPARHPQLALSVT